MKIRTSRILALLILIGSASAAYADTTVMSEDFESYPLFGVDGGAAFKAVWMETNGGGTALATNPSDANSAIITDNAGTFPNIQGKAADHLGSVSNSMVNQYDTDNNLATLPFNVVPSASQRLKLSADVFVGSSGNERMTIGLRGRDPGAANLIEMGAYNANTCNATVEGCNPNSTTITPTTPGFVASLGFAYRLTLFGSYTGLASTAPAINWQYFVLPQGLDRTTDADEIVNIGDVGGGWHTYTAEITPTGVTVSLDLFRDGFVNVRDENGAIVIGSGTPGVDATHSWGAVSNLGTGYDSVRIGGPSGLTSPGPGAMGFDNILLQLVDNVAPIFAGDFNDDGVVDAADYVMWRKLNDENIETGLANDPTPTVIDSTDYDAWVLNFGNAEGPGSGGNSGAVPEPTTIVMLLLSVAAIALGRRSR